MQWRGVDNEETLHIPSTIFFDTCRNEEEKKNEKDGREEKKMLKRVFRQEGRENF
jgi:hypothetical protein